MKKNLKPYVYKLWNNYQKLNRLFFVERSVEFRMLARLSTEGVEPKGNQVLRGRQVSIRRPETG